MGMKWTALAMDNGPRVRSERLLLLALCDRADEQGVCWPSRADLCQRASMSLSTLTRCLRALEHGKWIQRQKRFNTSNKFRVNVWKLQELDAARRSSVVVAEGFEPFPEEAAALAKAAQVAEKKGKGHSEPGSGHSEPGSGHSEPGSGHSAVTNLSRTSQEPSGVRAAALPAVGSYARKCLEAGNPVTLPDGVTVKPGQSVYLAWQAEMERERHGLAGFAVAAE